MTAGLLSQIETGRTQPSVGTLYLLVERLGVSLDWLVGLDGRDAPRPAGPAVRSPAERPVIEISHGVRWEVALPGLADGHDLVLVEYAPGATGSDGDSLVSHEGREGAYLIAGQLVLQLEDERFELQAGDVVDFDARRPHAYRNESDAVARGLWLSAAGGHAG